MRDPVCHSCGAPVADALSYALVHRTYVVCLGCVEAGNLPEPPPPRRRFTSTPTALATRPRRARGRPGRGRHTLTVRKDRTTS